MTGGGAAGLAGAGVPDTPPRRFGDAAAPARVPFLRPAPGRRDDAAAGAADVRGVRPHDHDRRRAARPAARVDGAAALMTAGPAGRAARGRSRTRRPQDTGEAVGLRPARLTLTFGLGPGVFLQDGHDRFGLAVPPARGRLRRSGPLPGDQLVPGSSGGDMCVQACADDPQVAFHAVRDLARIGRGAVVMRWTQLGFGRAASTSEAQATPAQPPGLQGRHQQPRRRRRRRDGPASCGSATTSRQPWMRGGTYAVTRRIRMLIETWDRSSLGDQQDTIGRDKTGGRAARRAATSTTRSTSTPRSPTASS